MPDRRDFPDRLPHAATSSYAHDRHGLERTDDAWLERTWADPATRVLVIAGNRLLVTDGRPTWLPTADLPAAAAGPDALRLLLGEQPGDASYFAAIVDPAAAPGPEEQWRGLRDVLGEIVDTPEAPLVLHAMGMAEWHWSTSFCPRCAGPLTAAQAGHVLACASEGGCGRQQFPRTDPAVIMLITDGEAGADDERCLLGRNRVWPPGRYSTLAGFVEPGETFEDAVRREVWEETGVRVADVTYFGNQPWPLPASVMIGFTGHAASLEIDVDGAEVEDAQWYTRADIRRGLASGELMLPGGISISHALIQAWYGEPLDSTW